MSWQIKWIALNVLNFSWRTIFIFKPIKVLLPIIIKRDQLFSTQEVIFPILNESGECKKHVIGGVKCN